MTEYTYTYTHHFTSYSNALKYYRTYEPHMSSKELSEYVQDKLRKGEIAVRLPQLKEGEILRVDREEGRYVIARPV